MSFPGDETGSFEKSLFQLLLIGELLIRLRANSLYAISAVKEKRFEKLNGYKLLTGERLQ